MIKRFILHVLVNVHDSRELNQIGKRRTPIFASAATMAFEPFWRKLSGASVERFQARPFRDVVARKIVLGPLKR
ncbi:MAG: hypothetical protein ACRECY_06165 [Phyllobacterium sp.]